MFSKFRNPSCAIAAEDMSDCFHHLTICDGPNVWARVERFWSKQGVTHISVPAGVDKGRGRLGVHDLPGWLVVPLSLVSAVLSHFAETNFVHVGGWIGREL